MAKKARAGGAGKADRAGRGSAAGKAGGAGGANGRARKKKVGAAGAGVGAGPGVMHAVGEIGARPRTPEELHAWIGRVLGVSCPVEPMIRGHSTPFDYLCFAFFEEERKALGTGHWAMGEEKWPNVKWSNGQMRREVVDGGEGGEREYGDNIRKVSAEGVDEVVGAGAGVRGGDCVVWANRGGGKTFMGAVATALDLVFKPGIEVRVLGGSLEQSKRMHAHLRRLFGVPMLAALVDGAIKERRLRLVNGSEVEMMAQSEASVRGTRVQKLRCDEVELFKPEVWEAAQLTTRSKQCGDVYVRGSVECLSTMHRPYGIMHSLVRDARARSRRLFRWSMLDVLERCDDRYECDTCVLLPECKGRAKRRSVETAGHIEVADAVRMKRRVAESTWNAEMMCVRPRATDLVFPEFDAAVHVRGSEPGEAAAVRSRAFAGEGELALNERGLFVAREGEEGAAWEPGRAMHDRAEDAERWVCGMDFGFRGETAILWGYLDEFGVLWIVDERVVDEVTLPEHVEAIVRGWSDGWRAARRVSGRPAAGMLRGWPWPAWVGVDPAGAQVDGQTGKSAISLLREAGLTVRHRRMTIEQGVGLVRARLKPAVSRESAAAMSGPGDGGAAGPRLVVHERCERLISCLEQYHYDPKDRTSMTPVKDGHDHAVDALRYLVQNLGRGIGHRGSGIR